MRDNFKPYVKKENRKPFKHGYMFRDMDSLKDEFNALFKVNFRDSLRHVYKARKMDSFKDEFIDSTIKAFIFQHTREILEYLNKEESIDDVAYTIIEDLKSKNDESIKELKGIYPNIDMQGDSSFFLELSDEHVANLIRNSWKNS